MSTATDGIAFSQNRPLSTRDALEKAIDQLRAQQALLIQASANPKNVSLQSVAAMREVIGSLLASAEHIHDEMADPLTPHSRRDLQAFGQRMKKTFGWLNQGLDSAVTTHQIPLFGDARRLFNILGDYEGHHANDAGPEAIYIRNQKYFVPNTDFTEPPAAGEVSFLDLCHYEYLEAALDPKRQGRAIILAQAEQASSDFPRVMKETRASLMTQVIQLREILKANPDNMHRDEGWQLEDKINRLHGEVVDLEEWAKKKPFNAWSKSEKKALFSFADRMEKLFHSSAAERDKAVYGSLSVRMQGSILNNRFFAESRPLTVRDIDASNEELANSFNVNPLLRYTTPEQPESFLDRCDYTRFFQTVSTLRHAEIVMPRHDVASPGR